MNFWQNLVSVIVDVLREVIQLFPLADSETLSLYTDQINSFRDLMAGANWLFPVGDFFTLLSAIVTIELSIFTFRLTKFIIKNVSFGLFKG